MINGVTTRVDGDHCAYCDAKIIGGLYNFCPKCGNPLNVEAIKLKEQQTKHTQIELLDDLAYLIEDEKSLQVILNKVKEL